MQLIGLIIAAALVAEILLIIFLPLVGWSILGFILLCLLIVLLIPIGAELSYINSEFKLSAKISAFSIKLFPRKEGEESKPKKEKAPKKKKAPAENAEGAEPKVKKKLALNFEEIMEILKKALHGLGKFGRLTVHNFMLHYVAAGKDPYSTAMSYNYVNAALSSLAPLCSRGFNVKGDVDVWTNVDFTEEKMLLECELGISLRLIQLLHVAIVAGVGVISVLIRNKLRLRREKRAEIKTEDNTQTI